MVFKKCIDFIKYWYLQYTLNTALYMLEPVEVKIVNTILVSMIAIGMYSAYIFIRISDHVDSDVADIEFRKLINDKIEL